MTCTGRCRNRWHSTDCTTGPNYLKSTLGNGRVVWLSTDSSLAADGTSRYKAIQLYRQCLNSEPRCEPACKPEHLSMKTNSWWKKQTNKQPTRWTTVRETVSVLLPGQWNSTKARTKRKHTSDVDVQYLRLVVAQAVPGVARVVSRVQRVDPLDHQVVVAYRNAGRRVAHQRVTLGYETSERPRLYLSYCSFHFCFKRWKPFLTGTGRHPTL